MIQKCFICGSETQSDEEICLCVACQHLYYVDGIKKRNGEFHKIKGIRNRYNHELIEVNKCNPEYTVKLIEYVLSTILGIGFLTAFYFLILWLT